MESRVVLGVPDAYELPPAPGNGYLKFATEPMVRFKAAYVSGPVDEQPSKPESRRESGQVAAQIVPYLPGYIRPQVVEQPSEPEQPEPEEIKNQASLFDVVVGQLAGHGAKAHQIWLPPLDEPPPLNEMLPVAGDDTAAKNRVCDIVNALGFDTVRGCDADVAGVVPAWGYREVAPHAGWCPTSPEGGGRS